MVRPGLLGGQPVEGDGVEVHRGGVIFGSQGEREDLCGK